ncbi:hypothetical protein YPC_4268 [Yersinia pestis biovar Medievalis str. Harbin 35]|nr:hypothetical protein YPC_4268 [Yersinia pestis biovar Medievalis str. Harbin 35]
MTQKCGKDCKSRGDNLGNNAFMDLNSKQTTDNTSQ